LVEERKIAQCYKNSFIFIDEPYKTEFRSKKKNLDEKIQVLISFDRLKAQFPINNVSKNRL
jgi:hypothetical protein